MFFINVFIILMVMMLAVLSRKHHSKYKKRGIEKIFAPWLAMGETIYEFAGNKLKYDKFKSLLRKINVVSPNKLGKILDEYVIKFFAFSIALIALFNAISTFVFIYNKISSEKIPNYIITREPYDGDTKTQEIYLHKLNEEEMYMFDISPVQLSREEFLVKAQDTFREIDNTFSEYGIVSSDLNLPDSDSYNVFTINWKSWNPEVISSTGGVNRPLPVEEVKVKMTATIEYLDYQVERDFYVSVGRNLSEEQRMRENLEAALRELDTNNPNQSYVELPKELMGYEISIKSKKDNSMKYLGFGFLSCVIFILLRVGDLKDKVKDRDRKLVKNFPTFVNKLWLYLGTGMTTKAALKRIVQDNPNTKKSDEGDILIREIEYTLNQIDTGCDEAYSYEDCGERLGLPMYKKLMRQISQNIKMGTKDLRILMENQMEMALEERKEFAKKSGEEASTKLVFPMVVLLVVVMIIIMLPALMGM